MNDTVKVIVQSSLFLVALEAIWRAFIHDDGFWVEGTLAFFFSYILCILSEKFHLQETALVKSAEFKSVVSVCHGLDGVNVMVVGLAMYYKNLFWLIIGLLLVTKFCLIHILNRMILAKAKADNFWDSVTQTSKSYLHHLASFLFLHTFCSISVPTCLIYIRFITIKII